MGAVIYLRAEPLPAEPAPQVKDRKICRREVKRTMRRLGWSPVQGDGLRGDEVTKLWLAARCAACRRCPKLTARLAAVREGR